MPVVLDPFQNIVNVGWGGIKAITVTVDYDVTSSGFAGTDLRLYLSTDPSLIIVEVLRGEQVIVAGEVVDIRNAVTDGRGLWTLDDEFAEPVSYPAQFTNPQGKSAAVILPDVYRETVGPTDAIEISVIVLNGNNPYTTPVNVTFRTYTGPSETGSDPRNAYGNLIARHDAWNVWDFENFGYASETETSQGVNVLTPTDGLTTILTASVNLSSGEVTIL